MTSHVQVHYTPANDTVTLILPKFNDISLSILEAHQLILSLVDAVPCKGRAPWPDMPPGVATKLGNLSHIGYVQRRAAEGMCAECGRIKPKPGYATCVPCLAASNESTVARKKGRVRAGLCVTHGGAGALGMVHGTDARTRIGVASIGRTKTPATRATMNAAKRGVPLSPEHCAKLAAAKLGIKRIERSAEHKARISEGLRRAHALRRAAQT